MEEQKKQELNEEMSMEELKETAGGTNANAPFILNGPDQPAVSAQTTKYGVPEDDGKDVYIHFS